MSRMTKKCRYHYGIEHYEITNEIQLGKQEALDKLGEIEDLMEKYEIESVEKLEEILKDYDDMAKDIVEMGLGVKVDFKG